MINGVTAEQGERATGVVAAVTTVAGAGLLLAPDRIGPLIGVSATGPARALGVVDLALVPALLGGRPRWAWLAVRAATNLAMAAYVLRGTTLPGRARGFAVAMCLASTGDTVAVLAMRRAGV
ncbi:hypothetical protein [Pseudonocardia broussonetiae]|uniref:DUF4267 domain-containing protein n=1 Tax=Pseudonocardia broussonetiae TaxID=2736640 RepID=A0A6M6JU15_9PSEU|nr:hypothetical protein [Pseudonocardia broussonetiae]QJY49919.1 hypothetical protein HOP40_32575 [Pseudonocardia broussonetiae]